MVLTYIGLTDDPEGCKRRHGHPRTWRVTEFSSRESAAGWLKYFLENTDYRITSDPEAWRYGYSYSLESLYFPGAN